VKIVQTFDQWLYERREKFYFCLRYTHIAHTHVKAVKLCCIPCVVILLVNYLFIQFVTKLLYFTRNNESPVMVQNFDPEVTFADCTVFHPIMRVRPWDHATVNGWNTRLHRCNSLASLQSWHKSGRLPVYRSGEAAGAYVYRSRIHDVAQLKSRLIKEWKYFKFIGVTSLNFLQLGGTLFVQNLVKIRYCLPELWKCIHWFTFFPDLLHIVSRTSSRWHTDIRLKLCCVVFRLDEWRWRQY